MSSSLPFKARKARPQQAKPPAVAPAPRATRLTHALPKPYPETQKILAKSAVDGQLPVGACNPSIAVEVVAVEGKGDGVVARTVIPKDTFVCEYTGAIVTAKEADELDVRTLGETGVNRYCFYFLAADGRTWKAVDPSDTGLGRVFNHSRKRPNLKPALVVDSRGGEHIVFFALRDIKVGEEMLFDYGERNGQCLANNPWLKE
jgi:hypothetical protein